VRGERLAVYTTMYPGVEPWLGGWAESLRAQTDREFDLCIGLDVLSPAAAEAAAGRPLSAEWMQGNSGDTPARIRSRAIEYLAGRYDAVVFVDSDDLLHPSRIAAARLMLDGADVCGCALDIMDPAGRNLGVVFPAPPAADPASLLPRYNAFGLSNTAYRSDTLHSCLPIPDDCELVDWLLATRAWAGGARLTFDDTPRMRYRQYPSNVAPVLQPFSEQQVVAATARVLTHYRCVLDGAWPVPAGNRLALEQERARVTRFDRAARRRPGMLAAYVDALNALPAAVIWWWLVAHPALETIWNV
jgi:hypothetical protein